LSTEIKFASQLRCNTKVSSSYNRLTCITTGVELVDLSSLLEETSVFSTINQLFVYNSLKKILADMTL